MEPQKVYKEQMLQFMAITSFNTREFQVGKAESAILNVYEEVP